MAADKGMSVINFIQHYQRSILKSQDDEERLLHCLEKLHGLQVQVAHLQDTGVGRTVNALRKRPGPVGEAARKLVARWKQIVEAHVSSEDEGGDLVSTTQPDEEKTVNSCDTPETQSTPSPTHQEHLPRKHHQSENHIKKHIKREVLSEEEEEEEMEKNNHRHRSPSTNINKKQERISHHDKKEKSHHREHHSHEKSSSRNSRERERSSSKSSQDKSRSSRERSSHERNHHSESPNKESSKHHSNNNNTKSDDKHHKLDRSKDKYKKENSDSKHHNKHEKSVSSNSSSSSHSKDKKSDRHHHHSNHKNDISDKHSNSKNKDKKHHEKNENHSKKSSSESAKYIKSEPSTSNENNYKIKKNKSEPPLTFDFVKPKIKQEPNYDDSDDDPNDSFADALGALDLPVPKFKKENSPAKRKIKIEPVEESTSRVQFEENGNDSPVGASFEEALGFIDYSSPSKSKSKKDKKKKSSTSLGYSSTDIVKPLPKSEELAAILDLPTINPNYRPLPQVPVRQQRMTLPESDPLAAVISNKTQRTKVYSGVKSFHGEITSLQDMCIKILQENIDALEYIGYAPFYLMEPVLARASAYQLANIERYNPRLSEDTDELWQTLVQCEFRGADRQDEECWRDVYERSIEEREDKLGSLKAKIKMNNAARKAPQRTTKLAYVNSHVKPPRSVLRQQAKHGTARGSLPAPTPKSRPIPGDDQPGPSGHSSHASTLARTVGMLRDGPSMSIKSKKRPAPLMQKTLKFMKTSFRR